MTSPLAASECWDHALCPWRRLPAIPTGPYAHVNKHTLMPPAAAHLACSVSSEPASAAVSLDRTVLTSSSVFCCCCAASIAAEARGMLPEAVAAAAACSASSSCTSGEELYSQFAALAQPALDTAAG